MAGVSLPAGVIANNTANITIKVEGTDYTIAQNAAVLTLKAASGDDIPLTSKEITQDAIDKNKFTITFEEGKIIGGRRSKKNKHSRRRRSSRRQK
jgi:hypothetical protein